MTVQRICSIPNCGKSHKGHGYCYAHLTRLQRHGDPLGGGASRTEPKRFLLAAFAHNADECLLWPFGNKRGYGQILYEGKKKFVHRLVCEQAHGKPPTPQHEAAHSCGNGDKGCVAKAHLSWKTRRENEADKLIHGTHQFGENNPMAKLTEVDVRSIRLDPRRHAEIARQFGITYSNVSAIKRRASWGHIV